MLFGEHAVLHGHRSVVAAINRRLSVTLTPNQSTNIAIQSELGSLSVDVNSVVVKKPFDYVLACIRSVQKKLPSGFSLVIDSDISDQQGLGSSAAVLVATMAVLHQWLGLSCEKTTLFEQTKKVLQTLHPMASASDVAASVFGAMVIVDPKKNQALPMIGNAEFVLVYSGYKTPTPQVVDVVEKKRQKNPEFFHGVFNKISQSTEQAILAIENDDKLLLVEAIDNQQECLSSLGVVDETLKKIVEKLNQESTVFASKVSGSGLGDCVVGFGVLKDFCIDIPGVKLLHVAVDDRGLIYE